MQLLERLDPNELLYRISLPLWEPGTLNSGDRDCEEDLVTQF